MPAPATVTEFLDLVQKSGVTDEARTQAYVEKLRATDELPAEPSKLAGLLVRDGILSFFQAEQLLQGKWKRFFIGKYKVLEKIGTGGMGQVFLCEHKLMRRRVAVKVLPTAKAAEQASLDRFYREARAVAALDHPNIVRAYDIDQDDNLHFLVMEFVDGSNLQDIVKKSGPLDITRACHYAYGSAVGLQYAFEMGIVHRDIKPGNVLVDRSGVVKILDMGLARFFHDEDDQLTRKYDENILGTADYLAPEQAVDSHTVDIRADIYSLGGTFYFMLTGSAPFPEGSVAQKLLWHQTRQPRPVQSLRPEVPDDLVAVLAKIMAKNTEDRFQTPNEVLTALAPFVVTPIPPPPESEMPQLSPAASGGPLARQPSGTLVAAAPAPSGSSSNGSGIPVVAMPAATAVETPPDVWQSLGADTHPVAEAETQKTQVPPSRKTARPATKRSRQKWILAGGLLAVLAAAAVGVYFVAFGPRDAGVQTPHVEPQRKWYVGKGGPADRTAATIAIAISRAKSGDTIVLTEDITDTGVTLNGSSPTARVKELTIESGTPDKMVRWTVSGPGATAISVTQMNAFTLRDVALVLDGRFDTGIALTGGQTRLHLKNVSVAGAKVCGIRLSVSAETGQKIELDRLRIVCTEGMTAGVLFDGSEKLANSGIVLTDSRIDGPAKAAVQMKGLVSDVEVRRSRFFGMVTGVVIEGTALPADAKLPDKPGVKVANNTFVNIRDAAVIVDVAGMPAQQLARVEVSKNLFGLGVGMAVRAGEFKKISITANVRAAGVQDGVASGTEEKAVVLGMKPDDDATFLRYDAKSPLNDPAVGAPPLGK